MSVADGRLSRRRRIMPMQHAYAFLLVASEEGRGVQEYAERARVTQAVMTRILFALASRSRGWERGYGLVQQGIDTKDARKHQTFLTTKGKALVREIARLVISDRAKLQSRTLTPVRDPARDIARDQSLSRLIAAGRKLDGEDVNIAVNLVESLARYRQSARSQRTPK